MKLELGDCRECLPKLESNRFHSCVTDPPYELGFMLLLPSRYPTTSLSAPAALSIALVGLFGETI